ncbi:hypothetical protein SAMN05518682_0636 [Cellulosimicrobium aquatile]|uniref:AAA ATPase domain-containing protein n=2 Tax=Cellulosimicrobium aquatile TaxID=1612203 RepID=A0A1N6NPL7_9MICO|nr:hypothetical protein SAMN05518682_0636 [Cellulosimicrobium aquatile]
MGEYVRILLAGQQTHVITGTVLQVSPHAVQVRQDGTEKSYTFPTTAIVTIEVQLQSHPGWTAATMPPRLGDLLAPFNTAFLTGTGAIPRDLQRQQIDQLIAKCDDAERALIDFDIRDLTANLRDAIVQFAKMRESDDFSKVDHCRSVIKSKTEQIKRHSSSETLPLGVAAEHLRRITEEHWRSTLQKFDPRPRFTVKKSATRVAISRTGEVELPLRVQIEAGLAPASSIEVVFDDSEKIQHLTGAPLISRQEAGETRTVRSVAVLDHTLTFGESQLSIRAQLRYKTLTGETRLSPIQTILYNLVPESHFEAIPNPYRAYAGGTAVEDPQMFFGRTELLTDLVDQLRNGPLGTGFALYGQKRSGKTSLIEQVRRLCSAKPAIVTSVSVGILDRDNLTVSFVRSVLDQIRLRMLENLDGTSFDQLMRLWPAEDKIDSRPLESLQSALAAGRAMLSRTASWPRVRYIFLFDEFTYLFEVLRGRDYQDKAREDIREFMRQWKALLESRAFSSLIIGQDTMPLFMQRFPNEFSSMAPVRLGYLALDETRSLADKPILESDGSSRYTGYSLESIYEHTRGHPFFTQVLCDRIVRLANQRRKPQITEVDVDDAVESLVSGPEKLDPFRFDCLLTADNTGLVALEGDGETAERFDPDAEYPFTVLARIAALAGAGNQVVDVSDVVEGADDQLVINDLLKRDVLEWDNGVRIKMPLFAEYLRQGL